MKPNIRLLLVEDSPDDALLLLRELARSGFEIVHQRVDTAEAMQAALSTEEWDVIIADYNLPRFSALAALEIVRESGLDLPFIIVSGKIGEELAVSAMKAGAHDYMMKNSLQRLVPAIERELREAAGRRRHREAENSILQAKLEWEAAFNAVSDLIILTDLQGQVTRCNNKAQEYFGRETSTLVGRNIKEMLFGPAAPNNGALKRCCSGELHQEMEIQFPNLNGWYNAACYPMFSPAGSQYGIVYVIKDITERKEAEEDLRTQFNQISTIFDSLNAVVSVADMDTHELLYLNRYGMEVFGQDWEGKHCYEVLQADRTTPCSYCTNNKLIKDDEPLQPYTAEYRNAITGRWYQSIDRAIRWTDGRLVRMEIAIDITERKEMERMKDEMISAVSHEMHTPLTAMMGFTEFLLENEVERQQQQTCLKTMFRETERLNELINNFLQLQRMKANLSTFRTSAVSVPLLLKDAADIFFAAAQKHPITVDCPEDLPPVRGNQEQLYQVMTNLLSNAIKYSPEGGEIALSASHDDGLVTIRVKDQGLGIPAELQGKIFERFFRVDNTDRRMIGGTGLGLALVHEIVTAHAGRVWVESTPGSGSTFHVCLPVMKDA